METISIQETIIREVEVSFPCYTKSVCHFHKIISKTERFTVTDASFERQIQHVFGLDATHYLLNEESNELEFINAYQQVQTELNKILGL